eukprot:m.22459 g.22459  ORF g.22459 m.22459 type:complete len:1360 (+) comp11254_c0_seq3:204-4283(+)
MVNSLWSSVKALANVLLLLSFTLIVFSIVALQLFPGVLRQRCVINFSNTTLSNQEKQIWTQNASHWLIDGEGDEVICGFGSSSRQCPSGFTCRRDAAPNPNYGYTSFDNFGAAILNCFQLITLDFWEDIYNKVMQATSAAAVVYFAAAVFFGSFFIVNLVLAVVSMSYTNEVKRGKESRDDAVEEDQPPDPRAVAVVKVFSEPLNKQQQGEGELDKDQSIRAITVPSTLCPIQKRRSTHGKTDLQPVTPTQAAQRLLKEVDYDAEESNIPESDPSLATSGSMTRGPGPVAWKHLVRAAADSEWLAKLVTGVIILNTITLALYFPRASDNYKLALEICNYCWTFIFMVEFLVKITGLGSKIYFASNWNRFDCFIVFVSLVEILLESATTVEGAGVSIIRSFRLLRVLKLAQSWKTMSHLVKIIGDSIGQLGNLTLILGILMYMFAVIGMQLFGVAYRSDRFEGNEVPRWNFTDFWHSFLLIFRILCGEWVEPLWDTMLVSGYAAVPFYVCVLVIGNFIILNLFLALLLSAFDVEKMKELAESRAQENKFRRQRRTTRVLAKVFSPRSSVKSMERNARQSFVDSLNESEQTREEKGGCCCTFSLCTSTRVAPLDTQVSREPSWITSRAQAIIQHPAFDNTILLLIIWSSIMLAFEDATLYRRPNMQRVLNGLNVFFLAVFLLEAGLKMAALGLKGYFKIGWNILDFTVVLVSVIDIASVGSGLTAFRSLRTLRALRPLRAVSRWKGMKVVVDALFQSIPSIANVLLVCTLFWIIFSIIGVQFFGATFAKCVTDEGELVARSLVRDKQACLDLAKQGEPVLWINPNINFDTSWNGILALFQIATFEGWMELMESAVDSVGIDQQPQREYRFEAYIFFVIFILIGAFFTLNLFIGVIIDNFNRLKTKLEDEGKGLFLTASQRQYMKTVRTLLRGKPQPEIIKPAGKFASWCYKISRSRYFEPSILGAILLNTFVLCFEHYRQSTHWIQFQLAMNILFNIIFLAEAVIKLVAWKRAYFKDSWNIFDFCIVIVGILGLLVDLLASSVGINTTVLRVLRLFRIVRILRLVKRAQGLKRLLTTLILSGPALVNIGTLLLLVIFIFSIVGMNLFGDVVFNGAINDYSNFRNFGSAMVLLFRLSTAAGWNDVLDACSIQPPHCDPKYRDLPNGNCGDPTAAKIYFPLFVVITFLIVVNMYIAIILENLLSVTEEDELVLTGGDIDHFYDKWREYDPEARQIILYDQLPKFLHELKPPMGIKDASWQELGELDIPLYHGGEIHCLDVLHALANRCITKQGVADAEDLKAMEEIIRERFSRAFPRRKALNVQTSSSTLALRTSSAILIQRQFRQMLERNRSRTSIVLEESC